MMVYLVVALALLILALRAECWSAVATMGALLTNWFVQVIVVWATGEQFPYLMFIAIDYLSALMIVALPRQRWTVTIVALYALQMVCHAAYVLGADTFSTRLHYWWALTLTGWAQLAMVGGWLIHEAARRHGRAVVRVPADTPAAGESVR